MKSEINKIDTRGKSVSNNGRYYAAVMGWFALSSLSFLVGLAAIGPFVPAPLVFPLYLVAFVALLLAGVLQKMRGVSQVLSIAVPLILGIIIFPTLATYVSAGAASTVILAAVGTLLIFTLSAISGIIFKKDLSSFMPILFGVLLGAIGLSFLNAFLFKLPWLAVAISFLVIAIMVIYIYSTIQKIRAGGHGVHPSVYSLQIFVNIYNIFVSLLQIIGFFKN